MDRYISTGRVNKLFVIKIVGATVGLELDTSSGRKFGQ